MDGEGLPGLGLQFPGVRRRWGRRGLEGGGIRAPSGHYCGDGPTDVVLALWGKGARVRVTEWVSK